MAHRRSHPLTPEGSRGPVARLSLYGLRSPPHCWLNSNFSATEKHLGLPTPLSPIHPLPRSGESAPRTSRFPSNHSSDQSVAGVVGGMAQTPNPSRRSWVGPAPMPFLTPRPERRHLEMRWADGVSQSAARRSGVGAVAGNGGSGDGCERDREVNVQVVLRCR
jgi:hypothetical protein